MSSWAEIHAAARLLRVPPERLEGAVTRRVTVSLGVLGKGGLSRPPKGLGSPGWALGLAHQLRILRPQETPYGHVSRSLPMESAIDAR